MAPEEQGYQDTSHKLAVEELESSFTTSDISTSNTKSRISRLSSCGVKSYSLIRHQVLRTPTGCLSPQRSIACLRLELPGIDQSFLPHFKPQIPFALPILQRLTYLNINNNGLVKSLESMRNLI
ncbi:hypothetical protein EYC80_001114 [Monilinia laxa]|uniref:Uncharacterized protein n=1 Tax=Monilinia laxa TaxID=61186 RepID=A0A5N6K844_MONLA|nr:hypothetical protein EYC80_001114 [Monilinia laxa]